MTDQEILQIDFYDLCGIGTLWMTDEDKIKYWREVIDNVHSTECEQVHNTPRREAGQNENDIGKGKGGGGMVTGFVFAQF